MRIFAALAVVLAIAAVRMVVASSTPRAPASATIEARPSATPTTGPPPGRIVVDRHSVALFERIPQRYLDAAAATRMIFIDRSVGQNLNEGLECLASPTDEEAASPCRRHERAVPKFSSDPR